MLKIEKITDHIHRLELPYKDIFTTVLTVRTPGGVVLVDAASFPEDINLILPFLQEVGVTARELKYIFITHNHCDHSGCLGPVLEAFPEAVVMSRSTYLHRCYPQGRCVSMEDGDIFLDVLQVVTIPGHTMDAAGILDLRTNTLISGDALQAFGIRGSGTWAANINYPDAHVEAIRKLASMDIDCIVAAHDYEPGGYRAEGKEAIAQNLENCLVPLRNIRKLILENPGLDDEAVAALYNHEPDLRIKEAVIAAMRQAMDEGKLAQL